MRDVLAELFQRFIALFPAGKEATLVPENFQSSDAATVSRLPIHTVVVRGRDSDVDEPLAVVLLTVPSRSTEDPALLEFVVRRARAHKAPYFVTWTLRDAILWKTPRPGTAAARDSLEKLRKYPDLYEIAANDTQPFTEPMKLKVLDRGREILNALTRLLKDEALELVRIDATYFVGRLLDAVHRLLPMVTRSLHHRMQGEPPFRDDIARWALKQSIAGSPSDQEFAKSVARQMIYRLLGKVLFYQSLRRSARQLRRLELQNVDSSQVLPTLRGAFREALKIDYHAVFEEDLPDRIQWPSDASRELAGLITDFNTRDFAHLSQDVVGTVFERLIPPEERHGLGQYFTSENLCDLVTAFCVRSVHDKVLDPTCGTGTFLLRAYDRLRWLGQHDHVKLLSQLWGVDIAPFPAELATINLFRQRIAERGNFPRILCRDFFAVNPGDRFPFPPPKVDFERPEIIEEPLPVFNAVVGNFPYVSCDQIGKHENGYMDFLRHRLIDDWLENYPELFHYRSRKQQEHFEHVVIPSKQHNGCDRDNLLLSISTYADLYVYLFFHAARFLKPGGRMGIVTSNAWLDVNYGYELQRFFLRRFKIIAVLESRCEPWFTEAAVNTVVTILERCDSPDERDQHLARFVKVKRPLAELIPGAPVLEAATRWQHLDQLVDRIGQTGRSLHAPFYGTVTEEDDRFRVRIVRQQELREQLEHRKKTVKWGRNLRAAEVFVTIIAENKMLPLSQLAVVARGSVSGLNEFYYLTPQKASELNIEAEFLQPLLKSPGDLPHILIERGLLDSRIFVCRLTKEELSHAGKLGALRYIEWGAGQVFESGSQRGLTWPHGAEVRTQKPGWYSIPEHRSRPAQVFIAAAFGERHLHQFRSEPVIADKRLYFLVPKEGVDNALLAAVLNCSLTALSTELTGRVTLGDGVLELTVEDANDYLVVPDIRCTSAKRRGRITNAFDQLCQRPIVSVFEEVTKPDRQALDVAVLEAIGLAPEEYLQPIYDGLCELVRERVELGKMRHKDRQTRTRGERSEKKIAGELLQEILPAGPKRFPDAFLSTAAAACAKKTVELPDQPLFFDNTPLFKKVHTADNSFSLDVATAAEGKFILYTQRSGQRVTHIPEKMVEVTRAVANYEHYLRELRTQLYEGYFRRVLDTKAASHLTEAAFDRLNLPRVEA